MQRYKLYTSLQYLMITFFKFNRDFMNIEDRKCKLNASYNALIENGTIRNKKDFANILDVNYNGLTQAFNGAERYLTDSLISKIQNLMRVLESQKNNSDVPVAVTECHNDLSTPDKEARMAYQRSEMRLVPTIPYNVYKETNVDIQEMIENPPQPLHTSPAVAQFPLTDCHYFVNSDAMLPHLHPNDVLALKKIHEDAEVINGEICVINSKYNGLLARFVYDDGDYLILKASEAQSRFTDMRLHKDNIFGVYRILGLIRTNI